eukprot:g10891.t1
MVYLRGDGGGLEVRPSQIPSAGRGLFATRSFAAGELLCVYGGQAVPLAKVLRGEVKDKDYLMGGFGLYSVDAAKHPEVLARYINDHVDASKHNVKFLKLKRERRALAVAMREIVAGEEIHAFYGEGYWRARRGPMPAAGAK